MPSAARQEELNRIGAERLASEREVTRDVRRGVALGALGCVLSCGVGMVILFFAFWTNDPGLGAVFFWTGLVVGYSGMTASLLALYLWGEKRGYWIG
jgi:hypothetical protein